mmetsp:Transcript_6616/g.9665  ORF Transcript_6616/g.9665 Transcript_6616/m.9665 type:complete len:169 (-) Transcript_6616:308-814(-)
MNEHYKLVLLGVVFITCFITLFTSSSFLTGEHGLHQLRPPVNTLCPKLKQAFQQCRENEKENSGDSKEKPASVNFTTKKCDSLEHAANICEKELTRAYQHINLAGCLKEIESEVICREEFCERGMSDHEQPDCKKECDPVTTALNECTKNHVESLFKKWNIDGISMQK